MSERQSSSPEPFSEKGFYLQEFRGRTLALVAPRAALSDRTPLASVIWELAANQTRVIVLADSPTLLDALELATVAADAEALEGEVWRELQREAAVGIALPAETGFTRACRETVVRLGVGKVVWLDAGGGFLGADGARESFVHLEELREMLARDDPRAALLREIRSLLAAGVAAVNVCRAEELANELFTYAGSGTLFSRKRYLAVRRLGLDDYGAALDLIRRGVEEGYLAPRPQRDLDRVLAGGFGAFVEGRHLAGIGALLVYPAERAAEIASLYTLTRFLGEGVGAHLVAYALARAREKGLARVFACTTRERVGAFFERQGFQRVSSEDLPASRWSDYAEERRERLLCYQLGLEPS